MLDPSGRLLLTDSIAPEPGYRLDHALVTSFTLDLATLMEIPVALTFQEWRAKDQDSKLSRIAVLDAIQRYVDKLTVVSQAGYVTGPAKGHPLLPLLEPAVLPLVMPEHSTFHPKVTLLRYLANEVALEDGANEVTYKLICSSRNLSRSRAWDTIVVLDGALTNKNQADSKGLEQFVSGVNDLAQATSTGVDLDRIRAIERMAGEASQILFRRPPEIKDGTGNMKMVPIGFGGRFRPKPVRSDQKRLIITPFLGDTSDELRGDRILEEFASLDTSLVSRQSELDRVPEEMLAKFGEILVLSDLAEDAEADLASGDSEPVAPALSDLRGLHAKLIVEDDGRSSRILIGSPNLSERAFSQNREFALQLTVSKYLNGVEKILGTDPKSGLRRYLQEYVRSDQANNSDAETRAAERRLDAVRNQIVRAELSLRIDASSGEESDHRDLWIEHETATSNLPEGVSASARPISLEPNRFVPLDLADTKCATWSEVPVSSITSLIAIQLKTTLGDQSVSRTFVTKVRLTDPLPEARDRLIIRRLIDSSSQLLSYLAFLLTGSNDPSGTLALLEDIADANEPSGKGSGPSAGLQSIGLPLMEKLVQAVDRDPAAIESIAGIVGQLGQDEEGKRILSESGFDRIWKPVLEAHRLRKEGE